jgi:chemotaxis protein MotB
MKMNLLLKGLLLISVVSLASCVSNKKFQALEDENSQLAENLESVQEQVAQLEKYNADMAAENSKLDSDLQSVEQKLDQTETRMTQVEKENAMTAKELNELNKGMDAAFADINAAVASSDAKVKEMADALYLDLQDTVSFRTGSANISPDDKEAIERIANLLNENPNLHLVIEGNTDKRSINNDNYKDNWELSAARSIQVVRKLVDMGVDPAQLTAAGRAEHNPSSMDDPDSKATLAKNRRIELMVIPKVGTLYKIANK